MPIQTDLLIIGGGYTGCSAALWAVEQGLNTTLLEAATVGAGGSGSNMGMVNSGLWASNTYVEAYLGKTKAQALNRLLVNAPKTVFELIQQYGINCQANQKGTLHCAALPEHIHRLEAEQHSLAELGINAKLLHAADLQQKTGTGFYQAGLYHPHTGTLEPMAYVRGLARAATQRGLALYEHTPCQALQYKNGYWYADTCQGLIKANKVLVATNAYHRVIHGLASPRFIRVNYFRCTTQPLNQAMLDNILPPGLACWDIADVGSAFRQDENGRLIIGANGYAKGVAGAIHRRWAKQFLQQLYPFLGKQTFADICQGQVAVTESTVPQLVQYGPQALGIYGYSGRGIANATVLGRALAKALVEDDSTQLPLPVNTTPLHQRMFTQAIRHELKALRAHIKLS